MREAGCRDLPVENSTNVRFGERPAGERSFSHCHFVRAIESDVPTELHADAGLRRKVYHPSKALRKKRTLKQSMEVVISRPEHTPAPWQQQLSRRETAL